MSMSQATAKFETRWLGLLLQLSPYLLAGLLWVEDGTPAWTAAATFAMADAVFNMVFRGPWIMIASSVRSSAAASWSLLFVYKSLIAGACLWVVCSVQDFQGYSNTTILALGMGTLFTAGATLKALGRKKTTVVANVSETSTGAEPSEQKDSQDKIN
jgi:hypothetical protein